MTTRSEPARPDYAGLLTVNFTGTIRGGAVQRYQATVGVIINSSGAFPSPPVLIRIS